MPKVSIIVPCYKVEQYLDRCINSLVCQTLQDIEIILIDDESPDLVPQMCDNWACKDPRIRVVHKKNAGLGMACNSGIDIASGDYIAFCDSDDYVDLDCYEVLYNTAVENDVDGVYSGIKRVTDTGDVTIMSQAAEAHIFALNEIPSFQLDMIASAPSDKVERYRQMSAKIVLYSGKIIRDHYIRFHSERQYISEDLLFNLDFLQCCHSVMELPQSFYYYYVNTNSLSHTFRLDRFEKYKLLRNYLLCRYPQIVPSAEFRNRVDKLFIGYVRGAIRDIIASKEPYGNKRLLLIDICSDSIWGKLAQEYPIERMPLDKRLVFKLINHSMIIVLYLLFKLK